MTIKKTPRKQTASEKLTIKLIKTLEQQVKYLQRQNNSLQKQNNELTSVILNLSTKQTIPPKERRISTGTPKKGQNTPSSDIEKEVLNKLAELKEGF